MRAILFICLIFSSLLGSCQWKDKKKPHPKQSEVKESLMEMNKSLIKADSEKIRKYIERHKLDMKDSGTGLRYRISGEGTGEKAKEGQFAKVAYKVSLLDGTLCYSSEENGPEEFLVGMDDVESGLHEGISFMQIGQKAKFIFPPHLAHGLIGDKEKIPSRAILIYDIELLSLR